MTQKPKTIRTIRVVTSICQSSLKSDWLNRCPVVVVAGHCCYFILHSHLLSHLIQWNAFIWIELLFFLVRCRCLLALFFSYIIHSEKEKNGIFWVFHIIFTIALQINEKKKLCVTFTFWLSECFIESRYEPLCADLFKSHRFSSHFISCLGWIVTLAGKSLCLSSGTQVNTNQTWSFHLLNHF